MGLWTFLKRLVGISQQPPPSRPRTTTYAGETGLVEITAPAVPGQPLTEAETARHQFITSNWRRLAAAAYAGFQRHGIGVVVIEARANASAATDAFRTHGLAYATGMGAWTQRPPHSSAPDWLEEQFQTYEPLEAGLFLFRESSAEDRDETSGGLSAPRPYHAAGTPAPPQALRQARAPFN